MINVICDLNFDVDKELISNTKFHLARHTLICITNIVESGLIIVRILLSDFIVVLMILYLTVDKYSNVTIKLSLILNDQQ